MAKLVLKIELVHVGANEADRLEPLKSAVFEYNDERQAVFVFNLLTTRDCVADKIEAWPN